MDFPALDEAQGKLDHARKELHDLMQEAKTSRPGVYDMDQIKSISGDKAAKLDHIQAKNAALPKLKANVDKFEALKAAAIMSDAYDGPTQKGSGSDDGGHEQKGARDFADHFTKSEAFKVKGRKAHLDVDVKTLFQTGRVSGAGWTPEVTRSGLVTLIPMVSAPSVVDHLPSMPISQIAYKYMEETTYTNGAANTAEGATFGQAALALSERSQPVEKLTVWLPMTDEQLEDEPGAGAYVRARLENMVRQRLDLQVLTGDGTSNNLLGTTQKSGIQSVASGGISGGDLIDDAYDLFTAIRTDGFAEPNVAFIRPTLWSKVATLKTADGIYLYSNPAGPVASVLWGIPVVQTMAAPATSLVTGDYSNYAFLGIKRGLDVQVTNTHDTDFINGKQAIRMDMRCVMVHVRPKAFGVLTGLSA